MGVIPGAAWRSGTSGVGILMMQGRQWLINEGLTSRVLRMPAFVQIFSPSENTELVPGPDAAQKGLSGLPLNEAFCSHHSFLKTWGENRNPEGLRSSVLQGWAGGVLQSPRTGLPWVGHRQLAAEKGRGRWPGPGLSHVPNSHGKLSPLVYS